MSVAKLRQTLLSLAGSVPDTDPDGGTLRHVIDALEPFGDMGFATFAGLLAKVKPAARPTGRRGKTPEELAREKAERERIATEKAAAKQAEQARKAAAKAAAADEAKREKARVATEKAAETARKHREAAEKKRLAAPAPGPAIVQLGAELNDLIARSQREQSTYAEIDRHVDRLKPLTKPQLLQVARLINSDMGLSAKSKGEIVEKLGHTLRRVLGTAQRVKM